MPKILLIEDNEFIARMYQNIFTLEHYDVSWADNGEKGLQLAKDWQPDLIMLDIIMPNISGLKTLERLKNDEMTKKIPVVMLTVIGEEEVIEECFKLGASGYLIKPSLNPDQVLKEVKTYLDKSKS
jgi:CheY-like chemotaxis protein